MLKLSEARKAYEEASGKLSDTNRQLCFAGFGIIWLYNMSDGGIKVPQDLYLPGFFLTISLILDIIQYICTTILWSRYYNSHTSPTKLEEKINIVEPKYINTASWWLFFLKISTMFASYILIGKFLISKFVD